MELLNVFGRQAALAIESSPFIADLGRALFGAAASETESSELGAALRKHAETAPRPRANFAELFALFYELGRMGARATARHPRCERIRVVPPHPFGATTQPAWSDQFDPDRLARVRAALPAAITRK
jgi:hypothetical protein